MRVDRDLVFPRRARDGDFVHVELHHWNIARIDRKSRSVARIMAQLKPAVRHDSSVFGNITKFGSSDLSSIWHNAQRNTARIHIEVFATICDRQCEIQRHEISRLAANQGESDKFEAEQYQSDRHYTLVDFKLDQIGAPVFNGQLFNRNYSTVARHIDQRDFERESVDGRNSRADQPEICAPRFIQQRAERHHGQVADVTDDHVALFAEQFLARQCGAVFARDTKCANDQLGEQSVRVCSCGFAAPSHPRALQRHCEPLQVPHTAVDEHGLSRHLYITIGWSRR